VRDQIGYGGLDRWLGHLEVRRDLGSTPGSAQSNDHKLQIGPPPKSEDFVLGSFAAQASALKGFADQARARSAAAASEGRSASDNVGSFLPRPFGQITRRQRLARLSAQSRLLLKLVSLVARW
jgi:hypothetical protein